MRGKPNPRGMRHKYITLHEHGSPAYHKPIDNIKVLCRYGNVKKRRWYETISRVPFTMVNEHDDFEMKVCVRYRNTNRVLHWNVRDGYHILVRPEEMTV